jgi:hypothetical protein
LPLKNASTNLRPAPAARLRKCNSTQIARKRYCATQKATCGQGAVVD